MDRKSVVIWLMAGIGLLLIGNGINGFVVYKQTCCLPSIFCEEVLECDFAKPGIEYPELVSENMEFVIGGLMMLILLLVLYRHGEFFKG